MKGPNQITPADGGMPLRLASVAQWPAAAEFSRWAVSRGSLPGNESWRAVAKFSTIAGR